MGTAEVRQEDRSVLARGRRYVRRSVLLMAATFGLCMAVFGAVIVSPLGYDTFAGILGACGFAIFFFNVMWFAIYKIGAWYYS